jgi:chromosome segregation protein
VRLERLHLAPYGRFGDRVLTFRPDAALHVVLGANESGKTTALSAIGDLLFGFPTQTPYGFAHDQRALRISGAFRLSDGSTLELRRRKGAKNTLVDAADQPAPEDSLQRALGGIDRTTFETEFGLTAQALREGGEALLKAGGRLAETLAASSTGLSALSRSRDKLSAEADALFTSRRVSSKTFYLALDRHDEAERRLREAVVTADALKAAEAAELDAQVREIDLKAQHEETSRALARWQRTQRTFGKLARLEALARDLEAFADLPTSAAATLAEARAALGDDKVLRLELERLAADEAADQAAIGALGVDSVLLAQGDAIDALRERLGAVRKAEEDLPRRVEAHQAAQSQLDDLARRLGLPGHVALLAAPPTDPQIARVRTLIASRRRAEEKHGEALAARERAIAERDRLCGISGVKALDPEPLKRRLAGIGDVLADADRLRRERAACEAEAGALDEEAARLDPNGGDIDALARLALPDEASVVAHLRAHEEAAQTLRATEARLVAARRAVEANEAALAKRRQDGVGATRADWLGARERREAAFDRLAASLEGWAAERRERFDALRSLALAADATAESVLADTDRSARLEAERESLAGKQEEFTRAEAEVAEGEAARERAQSDWRKLWVASGLAPFGPVSMARWRERVGVMLARRAELNKRRADIAALASKVDGARASIVVWLGEFGAAAAPHDSFDETHRAARAHLEALQAAWMHSREIEIGLRRAEKDELDAESVVVREAAAREKHTAEWPEAMAGARLGGGAGLEEAEAALNVWDAVPAPRQAMARELRSIVGIEEDISSFEAGVAAVDAPVPVGGNAREILARLIGALAEARRAHDARDLRLKQVAARAVVRHGVEARREALDERLNAAMTTLGAPDLPALTAALDWLERRQALEDERAALRRDLAEIADGLDEAALSAEQADIDAALVPGKIELARQSLAQLLHEIGEAAGAVRDARSRLDQLSLGRNAAGAARDRQEAAGELVDIAERWIVRQAAARLATRAIERHRAAAQDPLITRAGTLFAIATAGAFAGLGTDYDGADRPVLVARRQQGKPVPIEGLTTGTGDQLFLSLRLALLERRAGEALPFIGDDILASFDDERTRRTLGLLAEYGAQRQVVVFTHHQHVADLARAVEGSAIDVLEMDGLSG